MELFEQNVVFGKINLLLLFADMEHCCGCFCIKVSFLTFIIPLIFCLIKSIVLESKTPHFTTHSLRRATEPSQVFERPCAQ